MTRSLRPSPYTSAVSIRVTPASAAAWSARRLSASSTVPQSAPIAQAPNPMTLTSRPVLPSLRYSIGDLQLSRACVRA